MERDFTYLLPLYYIADQYRLLGKSEAEMETLQLLAKVGGQNSCWQGQIDCWQGQIKGWQGQIN